MVFKVCAPQMVEANDLRWVACVSYVLACVLASFGYREVSMRVRLLFLYIRHEVDLNTLQSEIYKHCRQHEEVWS